MKDSRPLLRPGFRTADEVIRQTAKTGTPELDDLLGGGLESGMTHLFYGDRGLHGDLLKTAVHFQRPKEEGGLLSPAIVIDSANMIKIEQISDYSDEFGLEPEEVMDQIYISRAFNSSQTYDLVMNQLDSFFDKIPARMLIVSGLPDLYMSEGVTSDGLQELTHMATRLMTFTLKRGVFTLVSAPRSEKSPKHPAGGKALASCAQIHVFVEESKSYFKYTLAKHPQYPVRRSSRVKPVRFGTTLPLSHFLGREEKEE
ncbi:MAG: hypothetical protein JSW61_06535 [Candidatus Thorarchaeota archaeon]|nr:MAG: hypothetical protein JSW61_06535 [Candidatus Thorarchaeota archaeon]